MPSIKQAAQKAAATPYSAALANNSQAEQRARDVATRRQADNAAYTAFVMGAQGRLAAAGMGADQRAQQQTAGVQAATLQGNAGLGRGLQAARQAQGIQGTVPSQQVAGLADDAARQNLILGAATQRTADRSNTNAGKAGLVQAAALANMNAHSRAIAGDEFDQTSTIRRERTGLLADEANATMQQRAAEAAAAADIRQAELAAQSRDLDRASRESVAGAQIAARQLEGESDRDFRARQNRANRRVRLKTSKITASAGGYVDPAEAKKRGTAVSNIESMRDAAVSQAKQYVKVGGLTDPDDIRVALNGKLKGAPREVIDYALAAALGRKAGTAKGKDTATRRYHAYINRIKRGEVG